MRRSISFLAPIVVLGLAISASANVTESCSANYRNAPNLVVNCGFENGSQGLAPTGWTLTNYTSGGLTDSRWDVHSGRWSFGLTGNESLSQSFHDKAGVLYSFAFAFKNNSYNGEFLAAVDGKTVMESSAISFYNWYAFKFVGTGTDTISFSAVNASQEYLIDSVWVGTGSHIGVAPEPASWLFVTVGLGLLFLVRKGARHIA